MDDDLKTIFPEHILKQAKDLPNVMELAWPALIAKEVVGCLNGKPIVVLGGDIYMEREGSWKNITPNWFTEIKSGEQWASYAERSQIESLQFLNSHYSHSNVLFTLVLQTKPDARQLAKSYAR